VLWHCWLGHLTRKNLSSIWPISRNVFGGTFNLAQFLDLWVDEIRIFLHTADRHSNWLAVVVGIVPLTGWWQWCGLFQNNVGDLSSRLKCIPLLTILWSVCPTGILLNLLLCFCSCSEHRSDNFVVGLTDVSPAITAPTLWNYDLCAQYPGVVVTCVPSIQVLWVQEPLSTWRAPRACRLADTSSCKLNVPTTSSASARSKSSLTVRIRSMSDTQHSWARKLLNFVACLTMALVFTSSNSHKNSGE